MDMRKDTYCPECGEHNPIDNHEEISGLRMVNEGKYLEGELSCPACDTELTVTLKGIVFKRSNM